MGSASARHSDGILFVTGDPSAAPGVSAALAGRMPVHVVSPAELPVADVLAEFPAILVLVDGAESAASLEAARRVRVLPGPGRLLLLLGEEAPAPVVERALALAPAVALPFPCEGLLLVDAVKRLLDGAERRSARVQYRPTSGLLGVSAALRDVLEQVKRIAPTRMTVLILGETGTGKELVARAIHEYSQRAGRPFVAINCGALPESLLEAELFGVRKGAFTGAERDRVGLFEAANGGTLFLDEIGDTPLSLQAKLLRALESHEVRPIGGHRMIPVDVRILSATHRDLEAAVKEGDFRQDVFFRINTATIHLPPLRRRPVDIPFLAQHFAEEFGAQHARRIVLHEDFIEALTRRRFPGNVRELRNAVERAIALADPGAAVTADLLEPSPSVDEEESSRGTLRERVRLLEIDAIRQALAEVHGNRTRAAELLGLSRQGLRQKIERYQL